MIYFNSLKTKYCSLVYKCYFLQHTHEFVSAVCQRRFLVYYSAILCTAVAKRDVVAVCGMFFVTESCCIQDFVPLTRSV